jgi:hypothetical protein
MFGFVVVNAGDPGVGVGESRQDRRAGGCRDPDQKVDLTGVPHSVGQAGSKLSFSHPAHAGQHLAHYDRLPATGNSGGEVMIDGSIHTLLDYWWDRADQSRP